MKTLNLLTLFIPFFISCTSQTQDEPTFQGDLEAVEFAEEMFQAIGGKKVWCELRSLYIKAEHTQPEMNIPYTSEIWRSMDSFDLVIHQQNDSFHVKAAFTDEKGVIRYLDKRDTFRILTEEQLEDWLFGHNHNVYVLLHKLACAANNFRVEIDEDKKLSFYQGEEFVTSFELDDKKRPYLFYQPNPDGSISGSIFQKWGTDQGLVHSAGGHPLDSSFFYNTNLWEPSSKAFRENYGEEILKILD